MFFRYFIICPLLLTIALKPLFADLKTNELLSIALKIDFEKTAPYALIGWQEIDLNDQNKTTTATKINTVKLPYWQLNHLGDERFRDSLGLN